MSEAARQTAFEPSLAARSILWAEMARRKRRIGKIRQRPSADPEKPRFYIDFGSGWAPRNLYSFRGVRFESEEMATAILAHVEMELAKRRDLADVLSELAPEATGTAAIEGFVADWLELFRAMVAAGDRQPRTLRDLERWADPDRTEGAWFAWWYGRSIWEVDRAELRRWSYWMAAEGLEPKSRRNVMAGFSSFLTWLSERRQAWQKPKIPWPEREERLPHVLTLEERDRVLAEIPWEKRGLFLMLSWTGARPSEARVLRKRDWDGGDWIHVKQAAKDKRVQGVRRGTKKRREKVLPVEIAELRRWLEEHVPRAARLADPDGPLFANPAGHTGWWSETRSYATWVAACEAAGVPRVSLYEGTKHTLATALKDMSVDDRTLAKLFGHADRRSVEAYALVRPEAVQRAVRKLREK